MNQNTANNKEAAEGANSGETSLSSEQDKTSGLSDAKIESFSDGASAEESLSVVDASAESEKSDRAARELKNDSDEESVAGENLSDAEDKRTDESDAKSDSLSVESKNSEEEIRNVTQSPESADDQNTDSAYQNSEERIMLKPKKISVPNRGTFSGKNEDVERKWILIDASGVVVGRLASFIASRLRGKHKPEFTPHVDDGDFVVVINADKVVLTGQKYTDKKYYWHTGYPGGIKQRTAKALLEGRFPERVLEKAVKRMLPSGPLANKQYKNLRIYAGAEHPHEAQCPEIIEFGNMNAKNRKRA